MAHVEKWAEVHCDARGPRDGGLWRGDRRDDLPAVFHLAGGAGRAGARDAMSERKCGTLMGHCHDWIRSDAPRQVNSILSRCF